MKQMSRPVYCIDHFSSTDRESTYFPDAVRFENTRFLATDKEKLGFDLGHKKKNVPDRSLPSSAQPRITIYVRSGPFFIFAAQDKNILFTKTNVSLIRYNFNVKKYIQIRGVRLTDLSGRVGLGYFTSVRVGYRVIPDIFEKKVQVRFFCVKFPWLHELIGIFVKL